MPDAQGLHCSDSIISRSSSKCARSAIIVPSSFEPGIGIYKLPLARLPFPNFCRRPFENRCKHDRFIMLRILCPVDQRHGGMLLSRVNDLCDSIFHLWSLQFRLVAFAEFEPMLWIVIEPLP